jgi:Holliday junction resolvase
MEVRGGNMRRRARIDANQPAIVKALREAGATVLHLHAVGQGCPDLLVGWKRKNYLLEIKDPTKKPSQRKLTEDEKVLHLCWQGQVDVVETPEEAIKVIVDGHQRT